LPYLVVVTSLAVADARRFGDFVHNLGDLDTPGPFSQDVVEALRELIPCLDVVYFEQHPDRCVVVHAGELEFSSVAEALFVLAWQRPTATERLTTADGVVRLTDRIGLRELLRLDFYREVMEPLGIEDDLTLLLPAGEHTVAGFSFTGGEPFTDRDVVLLELLAPHLSVARERMARTNGLTEREWDVLRCVASGRTNKEIAEVLDVTPTTVGKHLEHIFEKLGVHTRTAAVARTFHAHD
jgi:DNA-binding CsgD family transcriptional regulator